jgi:IS605 OrfB family transposase
MKNEMIFTYQTRLPLSFEQEGIFGEYARLMAKVEHKLFAQHASKHVMVECKNSFLSKFGITARQFNSCHSSVDGKVKACQASQKLHVESLLEQIKSLEKQIALLEKKRSKRDQRIVHQKKRRLDSLKGRLDTLQEDIKQKRVRLCFGSRKLFNAQFYLKENGFASHAEWKKAWEERRTSEFFIIGSKGETAGNQTCQIELQSDGTYCLKLRLPIALEEQYGKHIIIPNITFAYGHQHILNALSANQAISYRFKKDETGWRVFVSTALKPVECISQEGIGAIGIDFNADHVACVETDRFGNIVRSKNFPLVSYGKSNDQLKALMGDLCKEIIDWAKETKKPVVIEELDFQKKKLSLKEDGNNKFSRLLSSFAYGLFFGMLTARAFKEGVSIHRVNPAYTSLIGRVNYATRYGLSIHLAAAFCIARRYQKFSEAPCSFQRIIPDGKGGHVAFTLPVRNGLSTYGNFWRKVNKELKTVLAARSQARNRSSGSKKRTPATANRS